ncbi:MAG: tyrosine-type recombinase/integrase family protein, partial [Oscillospiraceae bacterium]|nr:tyrosine-type recombinase/integrase family protein [Oscillospiraceae bacterium]
MGKRRPSDDGMVRKREDGRWEGRIVVGHDEKGLPKTKNVLAKTKSECSAKLNALKASLQGPREPKQEKPKADMTFGAWLDHWYQRECKPHIRPKTQADYENRIYQHVIPELGAIPLAKLTAADLQQFYNRLKEGGRLLRVEQYGPGLSVRMVKSCHVTCRMALDQAVAQGLILKNPALSCKAPVTRPKEMQVLTGEEIQRLLIQAKEDGC